MRNYLARLGWSHGDDELFTDAQALDWFDLEGDRQVARAARHEEAGKRRGLAHRRGWRTPSIVPRSRLICPDRRSTPFAGAERRAAAAMYCLKDRARSLPDLIEKAQFVLAERPISRMRNPPRRSMMYPVVYCQN
jgi:glutamyl-tRNA synthetase